MIGKLARIAAILTAILSDGGYADDAEKFYLVTDTLSMIKREDIDLADPWDKKIDRSELGADELVITQQGYFYDAVYRLLPRRPDTQLKTLSVRIRPHSNKAAPVYFFGGPTLISVKEWEGVKYLNYYISLLGDEAGVLYIPAVEVPDGWSMENKVKWISPKLKKDSFCFSLESIGPKNKSWHKSPHVEIRENQVCYRKVLPINQLTIQAF